MSWISDKLLGLRQVFFGGEQLPERKAIEFAGDGVEVEDDAVNKRTVVTIAGGGGGGGLPISETYPTAAGQFYVAANGYLWGYCGPQGVAAAIPFEIELPVRWTDRLTTAATTMSERILGEGFFNQEMSVTTAWYVPEAGLVAHADNYAQIRIYSRSAVDGGDQTMMFESFTTPSGLNFTGDWTAWVPVALGTVGGTHTLPAFHELTWEITVGGGSGVTVPTGRIFVQCIRTAAFPPEE